MAAAGLAAIVLAGGTSAGARDRTAQAAKTLALPDTPAGRQLAAWLQAYNTGHVDRLRRFIDAHYAPAILSQASAADRAGVLSRPAVGDGPLSLRRLEQSTAQEIVALAEAGITEMWVRI